MNDNFNDTLPVSRFMTRFPLTVDKGMLLSDARDRMFANNVRHLVVVDSRRLVGILSTRDIALANSLAPHQPLEVADAAVQNPFCCAEDSPLVKVIEIMETNHLGSAIVAQEGRVVGLFTTVDALRALRCSLASRMVEPLTEATHITPEHERVHVELTRHASEELRKHGCSPSPKAAARLFSPSGV